MEEQEKALQPTEENDSENIKPSSSLNSPTVQTEITTYPRPITSGFDNPILRCSMPECRFYCRTHVLYDSHIENIHLCDQCGYYVNCKHEHRCQYPAERRGHVDAGMQLDLSNFQEISRSHLGVIIHYGYQHPLETEDLETAFTITFSAVEKLFTELLNIHGNLRVEMTVGVTMERDLVLNEGEISTKTAFIYFKSKNHDLYDRTAIEDLVWECASEILLQKENFTENGSN
ncbi:unnamed protein product [Allacma fusca]|uniref:Uncharacterized protein n=1 Tax=Allacma fusca TaxID=39272 RepID=A0A8J2IY46_9HEXA|nr:unnamed protein product [Allacma fusca]